MHYCRNMKTLSNLNSNQINFVKHIVDYIVKNGSIDKKELKDFPEADKFGGLFQLFNNLILRSSSTTYNRNVMILHHSL